MLLSLHSAPWSFLACGRKPQILLQLSNPWTPRRSSLPLLPCLSLWNHTASLLSPSLPEVCLSQSPVFPSRSPPKYHFHGASPDPRLQCPQLSPTRTPLSPLHLFPACIFLQSAHHLYLKLYYRVILFIKCTNQFYNSLSNTQSPGRA